MVNDTVIAPRNAVNRTLLNLYSVDTTEDNAQINHTNSKNLQIQYKSNEIKRNNTCINLKTNVTKNKNKTFFPNSSMPIFLMEKLLKNKTKLEKSYHAGLPPKTGVKWLCNVWVRINKIPEK